MSTIVEYTDWKEPANLYPTRIISPPRSGVCCFSNMEDIGTSQREGNWEYVYKRCRQCGFAVRWIVREVPNEALVAELRKIMEPLFQRNAPNL